MNVTESHGSWKFHQNEVQEVTQGKASNDYVVVSWRVGTYLSHAKERYITNELRAHFRSNAIMISVFFFSALAMTSIGAYLIRFRLSVIGGGFLVAFGGNNFITGCIFTILEVRHVLDKEKRARPVRNDNPHYFPKDTAETHQEKKELLKESFLRFDSPDIFFLQETYEITDDEWDDILPKSYTFFSDGHGMIAWKTERFTLIAEGELDYDWIENPADKKQDALVCLQDKVNNRIISAASVSFKEFSLNYEKLKGQGHAAELEIAFSGNRQLIYDLNLVEESKAELKLFAGAFNVDRDHFRLRLNQIEGKGYITDLSDKDPTAYDWHLRKDNGAFQPIKKNYIYAKGPEGLSIKSLPLDAPSLHSLEKRASAHRPIAARITFGT